MVTQHEPPQVEASPVRRLTRSRSDKVVAGVCGGLSRYFAIDTVWFRIAFVALAWGGGAGVLLYVIAWIAMPEDGNESRLVGVGSAKAAPIAGIVLLAVGLVLLLDNVTPWAGRLFWPAAVVAVGLVLLLGGRRD